MKPKTLKPKYDFGPDYFTQHIPAWKSILKDLVGLPDLKFLEIGSLKGRSAVWLLENVLTNPQSRLVVCDNFAHGTERAFLANIDMSGQSRQVDVCKGPSHITLRGLRVNSFDFVYVDGSHRAKDALSDIVLSWDLLKNDGIMIMDDYMMEYAEYDTLRHRLDELFRPKIAIDVFLYVRRDDIEVLHKGYQVIIKKKPSMEKGEEHGFISPLGNPSGRYQYNWITRKLLSHDMEPVADVPVKPEMIEEFIRFRSIKERHKLRCLKDVIFRQFLIDIGMQEWATD